MRWDNWGGGGRKVVCAVLEAWERYPEAAAW